MMTYEQLKASAAEFGRELSALKSGLAVDFPWYPYDTSGNITHLETLISAQELEAHLNGSPALDIGGADGELAFLAERLFGARMTMIDNPPTNNNGLRGFRTLRDRLGSNVGLMEIDLDAYFAIQGRYRFAFFLGILYHLKNPFYVLETLARHVSHIVLSTKITKRAAPGGTDISAAPLAYLLAEREANNDPTNYWVFTEPGLRRLFERTRWSVLAFAARGAEDSDPFRPEGDQRAFCYLRSEVFGG
jgi:hypothetical protein